MIIDKIIAIQSLVPGAQVVVREDGIEWHEPAIAPVTDAQIDAELARLQSEYDSKEYQRKRAAEYPSIADQLDTIYHDGIDAWKEQINTIKEKYPKG